MYSVSYLEDKNNLLFVLNSIVIDQKDVDQKVVDQKVVDQKVVDQKVVDQKIGFTFSAKCVAWSVFCITLHHGRNTSRQFSSLILSDDNPLICCQFILSQGGIRPKTYFFPLANAFFS
jgi:hypothetical protein